MSTNYALLLGLTSEAGVIPPPPYVPPISGTSWRVWLCDRFGYPIQDISRICFGKQYVAALNQPAQFTFWCPSNDPKVAADHTDGNPYLMEGRAVRVYRAGVLVFTGHIWQIEDAGDGEAVQSAVTCFDPLQWLNRRIARKMGYTSFGIGTPTVEMFTTDSGSPDFADKVFAWGTFDATGVFGGLTKQVVATEIARGLLNATNDYDGFTGLDDFYLSSFFRPDNATPALCTNQNAPAVPAIAIDFSNSKVSDVLSTIVGQNGSFDLEVVPTDSDFYSSPTHAGATFHQAYLYGSATEYASIRGSLLTKPWKTLALLKFWAPTRGTTQANAIFGYATYPHNVASISYLTDLGELSNASTMQGKTLTRRAINVTSVQTYGAGMDVQSFSDVTDASALAALATEEATVGGNAKRTLNITPMPGALTPLPFRDFNLGDTITVNSGAKLRGGFTGTQRVYGYTIDIADDHTSEDLAALVVSPQTA